MVFFVRIGSGAVTRILAEPNNRFVLEIFRLLVNRNDSLAWAGLLSLTLGIGETFSNYVYERARTNHTQFGPALLAANGADF